MKRELLVNILCISLSVLLMAAGIFVPRLLLGSVESSVLSGESRVSEISGTDQEYADPDYDPTEDVGYDLNTALHILQFGHDDTEPGGDARRPDEYTLSQAKLAAEKMLKELSADPAFEKLGGIHFRLLSKSLRHYSEPDYAEGVTLGIWRLHYDSDDAPTTVIVEMDSRNGRIYRLIVNDLFSERTPDYFILLCTYAKTLGLPVNDGYTAKRNGKERIIVIGNIRLSILIRTERDGLICSYNISARTID
ncbi:MAG: hypothetical protein K6F68_08565 [Clostridiales bacterium]|nr:hypothetical protein [Clostridiales bacterium]